MRNKLNQKIFTISILRPGGNDTAIVKGFIPKSIRKPLNDKVRKEFPSVEQCGFYEMKEKKRLVIFNMMGGEFSGNAMLAVTYLVLKGKSGKLRIISSGSNSILETGIKDNIVFSEIPIFKTFNSIKQVNNNISLVKLKGINHLVIYKKLNKNDVVYEAKKLFNKYKLFEKKCAGCIFTENIGRNIFKIMPVVWIRDVKTLTYESACGSGSIAVALSQVKKNNDFGQKYRISQPSGSIARITIEKNKSIFIKTILENIVSLLKTTEITL